MEQEILALRMKEKNSTDRLFRITFNFKQLDEHREKNMFFMKKQLEKKKSKIYKLEKTLTDTLEKSGLIGESQKINLRRSTMQKASDSQSESLMVRIFDLENKIKTMKARNRFLLEDLIDSKTKLHEENCILYSVFMSARLN